MFLRLIDRKRPRYSSSSSREIEVGLNAPAPNPPLANNMPLAETYMDLADISSVSAELKSILNQNDDCTSEELKHFIREDVDSLERKIFHYNLLSLST